MGKTFVSLVILFVVGSCLLVFQATRSKTALVLSPSELESKSHQIPEMRNIRVGGRVATLPIDYRTSPLLLTFSIVDRENPAAAIKVAYAGVKPDMFDAGRDVLIDGDFQNGTLQASKLLTQCPSKYEPPRPTRPN